MSPPVTKEHSTTWIFRQSLFFHAWPENHTWFHMWVYPFWRQISRNQWTNGKKEMGAHVEILCTCDCRNRIFVAAEVKCPHPVTLWNIFFQVHFAEKIINSWIRNRCTKKKQHEANSKLPSLIKSFDPWTVDWSYFEVLMINAISFVFGSFG